MTAVKTRRGIVFAIALLVLFGALIYGLATRSQGVILPTDSHQNYEGLVLEEPFDADETTTYYFNNRIQIGEAAVEARESVDDVDPFLIFAVASDAGFIGDLVTARETYETYFQYNPINFTVWTNYAAILESMGDLERAEEAYWQAVLLTPNEDNLGRYIRFLERNYTGERDQDILDAYLLSVEVVGQKEWNMVGIAEWYIDQGDCNRAIDHYEVALQLDPDDKFIQSDLEDVRQACK